MNSVIDFNAVKKWNSVPKEFREQLIHNVFCSKCMLTTIVDYTIEDLDAGVILKGKCQQCGKDVARFVEDI